MTHDNLNISLETLEAEQGRLDAAYRAPLPLRLFAILSNGLMVFGWGMTSDDNIWMLGFLGGMAGILAAEILTRYIYRLKGVRLGILPRTRNGVMFFAVQAVIYAGLIIGGRLFHQMGVDAAPLIAAVASSALFALQLRRYPLGK